MPLLLAAFIAGSMTVQQCEGSLGAPQNCSFVMHSTGHGARRDCGVHDFQRDDGVIVRVIISCK